MQLICLILSVVYLIHRRKVARANPAEFPNVPPAEFARWRTLELTSIDIFVWTTLGAFGLGMVLVAVSMANPQFIGFAMTQFVLVGLFLAGLIVSAIFGTRAASLKKRLGISLRKK